MTITNENFAKLSKSDTQLKLTSFDNRIGSKVCVAYQHTYIQVSNVSHTEKDQSIIGRIIGYVNFKNCSWSEWQAEEKRNILLQQEPHIDKTSCQRARLKSNAIWQEHLRRK